VDSCTHAVAEQLDVLWAKLSEWRNGKYKPDATNIAQLTELAGLPVFETLLAIEDRSIAAQ
jgi:hypothetical protein